MQPTHNTLSENIRAQSVELLNKHLAATIDLHAQVKQAHGNVRRRSSIAIQELFDNVSSEVENYSDLIAARARGLGGTVYVGAEHSFPVPYPLGATDEQEHVFGVSETPPHSATPHKRPSIKRQLSGMRIPPICSPKSRAASTINYGSSNPTSSPRNDRGAPGRAELHERIATAVNEGAEAK